MSANVGTIDRALRALIAGVVMLPTAGMLFYLLYRIFGIRTCQG